MNEDKKIGFFEEAPNQKSSGRLYVFMLLLAAIAFSGVTLVAGLYKYIKCGDGESLPVIATAAGGLLVTISGAALTYKSYSKGQENQP